MLDVKEQRFVRCLFLAWINNMSGALLFWRGGTSGRHIDITLKGISDIIYTVNARKYRWRSRPTHTTSCHNHIIHHDHAMDMDGGGGRGLQ
jgi:hypothetical protein